MGDFAARMFEEHDQLQQRIEKLTLFITTDEFDRLPEVERGDMKTQLRIMKDYFKVLSRRVSRQCT